MFLIRDFLLFLVFLSLFSVQAQEFNALDSEGLRHGKWQKKYPNSQQLRYQGTFKHGKEIGTFKFFDKSGGHPTAIKIFEPNNSMSLVTFYTTDGNIVSSGKMNGRERTGTWTSYHQDGKTIMSEENYEANELNGLRIVYFKNGTVAQRENYIKGKQEGEVYHYAENGKVLKKLTYKNGLLEGPAFFYNGLGIIEVKGNYKKNRKHGVWIYYKEGMEDKKVTYPQNKIGVQ